MDKFDSSKGDWPQYIERVDHFFTANGIDAGKKKSAFLSSVGSATYAMVKNVVSPAKPGDKSYDQLVTYLPITSISVSNSIVDSGSPRKVWRSLCLSYDC